MTGQILLCGGGICFVFYWVTDALEWLLDPDVHKMFHERRYRWWRAWCARRLEHQRPSRERIAERIEELEKELLQ